MKVLRKILFSASMLFGLALAAPAQKHDQKKPPPKDPPPVVTPGDKKPPKDNPPRNNGGDRGGKKPGLAWILAANSSKIELT